MSKDIGDKGPIGVAFDIGTTTIAAASVDMESGRVLGERALPNPQAKWGGDVVSRINAAIKDPSLLEGLSKSVREACDTIIEGLMGGEKAAEVVIAGNPVMEHLFLGISPEPLSRPPYKPAFKAAKRLSAKEAGLISGAPLYAFPLIGGFVGGDAVAVILCLGLRKNPLPALTIDIGTNSEIMLSSNGAIYATSAAAGPAFEGGEIEYGMAADKGAIQGVKIEGDRVSL
ncbi:MAG: ASKHA domain-containing protein, partial [Deltaproteobacteria bacterium]|nr:ASKHA domain-containing protein [Deltaproteobacteria bacterium]